MEAERCPNCGESKTLLGRATTSEGGGVLIVPAATNAFRWPLGVPLSSGCRICLSCGHVWARLEPDQIVAFIGANGTELGKQYLEMIRKGPYRELPDFPEARAAAEGVAEIDALMVSGKEGEATRRYRELTGTTWDQAILAVRHWRDHVRAKKLALLGWCPKEKTPAEDLKAQGHPMRDRWLDG
jgi:hypothetical protein